MSFETRLAALLARTPRPTLEDLIASDIDERTVLEAMPPPTPSDEVPDDTVPGE